MSRNSQIVVVKRSATQLVRRVSLILIAVLATTGCRGEVTPQARAPAASADKTMEGDWDITLRLERPMSFAELGQRIPRSVGGRITLLEEKTGRHGTQGDAMPTFVGVFDIDVAALGLPTDEVRDIPAIVAHRSPSAPAASNERPDSLFLVMNPQSPRHSVQLSGVIAGDRASGTWTVESPLGGGGSFVLQRHDKRLALIGPARPPSR